MVNIFTADICRVNIHTSLTCEVIEIQPVVHLPLIRKQCCEEKSIGPRGRQRGVQTQALPFIVSVDLYNDFSFLKFSFLICSLE
jgi:hypothetical protein